MMATEPNKGYGRVIIWVVATFSVIVFLCSLCSDDSGDAKKSPAPSVRTSSATERYGASATKWYSGGTLHKKSALEWQTASPQDKLATCGDFVTGMWQNGNLKRSIANSLSTVDDVRPYAQQLVDCLDAAFTPDPDPEQNRILFTNQTVAGFAAAGMVTMGWTK